MRKLVCWLVGIASSALLIGAILHFANRSAKEALPDIRVSAELIKSIPEHPGDKHQVKFQSLNLSTATFHCYEWFCQIKSVGNQNGIHPVPKNSAESLGHLALNREPANVLLIEDYWSLDEPGQYEFVVECGMECIRMAKSGDVTSSVYRASSTPFSINVLAPKQSRQ